MHVDTIREGMRELESGETLAPGRVRRAGRRPLTEVEHRLFSFISIDWRAKPLVSLEVIINLIAATTTRTGLDVYAQLDQRAYPDRVRVSDTELGAVSLQRAPFHPDWNYTIKPRT